MGEKSQESVARLCDGREPRNALRCIGLRDRHNDFSSLSGGPPVSKVLPWVFHRRNMDRNRQRCLNNCSKSFLPHTQPCPPNVIGVYSWLALPAHFPLISQESLSGPTNDGQTKKLKA